MSTIDTCTEEQAIALAGVSARTLHRFCESGYLTQTTGEDGQVRYVRSQLKEIFGALDADQETADQETADQELGAENGDASAACYSSTTDESAEQVCAVESVETHQARSRSEAEDTTETEYTTSSRSPSRATVRAEIEIERLKNLLAIQERMLDSKDDEIADLKNQRAWLRQRIEKLEEKHDRDQILLLSETQTIRSLISYQESRKSTFRQLLEWIGIAQSTNYTALPQPHGQSMTDNRSIQSAGSGSGRTIEVKQAANQG